MRGHTAVTSPLLLIFTQTLWSSTFWLKVSRSHSNVQRLYNYFISLLIDISHQRRIDFYMICVYCVVYTTLISVSLMISYSVVKPVLLTYLLYKSGKWFSFREFCCFCGMSMACLHWTSHQVYARHLDKPKKQWVQITTPRLVVMYSIFRIFCLNSQ